jgi:hypothetical protein
MPLKLNVGLSRKVGEPNYGSRGATVNLELEVDSTLAAEPVRLQERIRELFALAKASVDEELRVDPAASNASGQRTTSQTADNHRQPHATGRNGASRGVATGTRSNGSSRQSSNNPPPATASQVRALHAIANRQGLNLDAIVSDQFGATDPAALTISQASELIDELNHNTAAAGGR